MALFELKHDALQEVAPTRLAEHGVGERTDLQRLLRSSIDTVAPGIMVIAEEFAEWEDSRRRIDLLCLDQDGTLVVVELKRGEDGGHMELQALRYAAMVSGMTFEAAVRAYQEYLRRTGGAPDTAEAKLLEFLGWDEPREEQFGREVRIVLVASDFSREITTAVLWLNERDLDIRCVRLRPLSLEGRVLLDVQQVIPLPEASDYQVRLREKSAEVRTAIRQGAWSGYWFVNVGEGREAKHRCWEDCREHGYLAAGGGRGWSDQLRQLSPGDRFFAYLVGHGYVGLGTVLGPPVLQRDFTVQPSGKRLLDLSLRKPPDPARLGDPERADYCVPVRWDVAVDRGAAAKMASRRQVVCKLRDVELVDSLREFFAPTALK